MNRLYRLRRCSWAVPLVAFLLPLRAHAQVPKVSQVLLGQLVLHIAAGDSGSTPLALGAQDGSEVPLSSVSTLTAISNHVNVARARVQNGRLVVSGLTPGDATVRVAVGQPNGSASKLLHVVVEEQASPPPASAPSRAASAAPTPSAHAVAELVVPADQLHLVAGERDRVHADAFDANHAAMTETAVRYVSTNRAAVQVDSITGEVTALGPGTAVISITAHGSPATAGVTITVEAPQLRFAADTFFFYSGVIDTLSLLPQSGQRAYRGTAVWASTDVSVARVDPETGILTAGATGSARVSAQSPGWTGGTTVVVLPMEVLHRFQATVDSPMVIPLGGHGDLTAVGLDSTGKDTTHPLPVEWTIADTNVARIEARQSVLSARRLGTTALTARVRTIRADRAEMVYHWPVRVIGGAVTISPRRIGMRIGGWDTLSALLLDSLGQPSASRPPVGWRVDSAGPVRMAAPGILEAVGVGRATVAIRTGWDSTASATVLVAPDLVFAYGSKPATGAAQSVLRGLELRGGVVRPLGAGTGREEQPAVSPDRTRILYTSREGAHPPDIWVMDADGANRVNLSADTLADSSPVWSYDGSEIFFVSTRAATRRVYKTDPAGAIPVAVTDSAIWVQSVTASPDGKWLAYSTLRGEQYDLYTLPLREGSIPAGGEQRLVATADNEVQPRYASRTGDLFYLRQGRKGALTSVLMRLKASTGTPEAVTDSTIRVMDFAVAPEGDRVVVVAYRPREKAREPRAALFLLDVRGGVTALGTPLVDDPSASYSTPAFTP